MLDCNKNFVSLSLVKQFPLVPVLQFPPLTAILVFVPRVSVANVSINWLGKLKAAELSLVASLKAKADISDLIGCKSTVALFNLAAAISPVVILLASKLGISAASKAI